MTDTPNVAAPKPTIRDVASAAGVSKSLVSLVLQGSANVSESRRRAVLEAMEQLGYRPNRLAQRLSGPRSGTVGVMLNDIRNPWFVELLEGLTASLHAAGVSPVLADSYTDNRVGRSSVETLLEQRIDGLVVVGTTLESAAIEDASRNIPVVLAGTREPELPGVDIVVNDDDAGARQATEHLLHLGHRRIAHLQGPGIVGRLRRESFERSMLDAGLEPVVVSGGVSEESAYAAATRLLSRPGRPTAIFAYNDIACIGALSAADDQGLAVPGDLSLVGYDNTYLAKIRHLSLTSVDNGNLAVGVEAGKFILERLTTPDLPARLHQVPSRLQVRGSSGDAPREG
ncbi:MULTISPECIES: LacI family DNA-binding transcriptional regulator [Paenarthrobacter]|uniref:LacI family transcriptional regulator n=1 Tax=Paenarthrobacter ureafaciens TaxID=37931 RepID=A0AAX3EK58_PAEUR|nr:MULTISPECIES: LacI family DNA-binding transcriptional regulator [Paenarthrobacter]NKR13725.1 LacI family transcriptional regulator [Arthrobacter sp. M5]NKR18047.1 LacI family transcriptional regulator [Arthrobacter sp. M6]OEH58112.1 LacI family transcriptional regulator [Arthrobacter sp. D4]OEH58123.1 LacI family transcriptional regulator [Arthrobacter sp. D2]MDO5863027.1 LacI family transcriptional regulator [Paenarthrobacter sp. SD-2]